MIKLVWTELSRDDLKSIFTNIAEHSQTYASITVNKIYLKAQKILPNPYSGRVVPEFNDEKFGKLLDHIQNF